MTKLKNTLLALSIIGLQACGGGGGGGSSTPVLSLGSVQGVYDTTAYSGSGLGDATKAARAVVLANGDTWLFLRDGLGAGSVPVGVAKATVTVSGQTFSGSGKRYMLADKSFTNLAVTGSVPAASTLGLSFSDSAGGTTTATTTAAMENRFNALAARADMAADWTFSATEPMEDGTGSVTWTWNWTVDDNGTLGNTGGVRTGPGNSCIFTGTVLPRREAVAVFDVSITEDCNGTVRILSGVAFQNTAKDLTTFGLILNDGSSGTVVEARKVKPT